MFPSSHPTTYPPRGPPFEERRRGAGVNRTRPLLPPFLGSAALYGVEREDPRHKDMLTRCPAAAAASFGVGGANVAAAGDTALPGPAPAVTPSGTPRCKSAGTRTRAAPQT